MFTVELVLFILDTDARVLNVFAMVFGVRVLELQHRVLLHHGCGVAEATAFAPDLRPHRPANTLCTVAPLRPTQLVGCA